MDTVATRQPRDGSGSPLPALRPGVTQNLDITGTSEESAAISGGIVRLSCDIAIRVKFGPSPLTAVIDEDFYMPANTVEYFHIDNVTPHVIAAIADDGAGPGELTITEML